MVPAGTGGRRFHIWFAEGRTMKINARFPAIAAVSTLGVAGALFAGTPVVDGLQVDLLLPGGWPALAFDPEGFVTLLVSLFAIMNPVVAVPLFVSMTEGRAVETRRKLALVIAATVCIALTAAAVLGEQILALFAIGIPSFRIAGGIIVLLMGLTMLQAKVASGRRSRSKGADAAQADSEAICPIAIPLLAGPGAIATVILRCQGAEAACDYVTLGAVIAVMVVLVYLTLRAAVPIARVLGGTGLMVLTRLMGMIIAAIAIDMAVIGIKAAFAGVF
jgi:multiple antibiotic resistance protein